MSLRGEVQKEINKLIYDQIYEDTVGRDPDPFWRPMFVAVLARIAYRLAAFFGWFFAVYDGIQSYREAKRQKARHDNATKNMRVGQEDEEYFRQKTLHAAEGGHPPVKEAQQWQHVKDALKDDAKMDSLIEKDRFKHLSEDPGDTSPIASIVAKECE